MGQVKNRQRLKRKIKRLLVSRGLEGIPQAELIAKTRTYNKHKNPNGFTGQDIRDILTEFKVRELVQKFPVTKGYAKKPTTMWRATKNIVNERL